MPEVKTKFPTDTTVPSRFPLAKQANVDELSGWPVNEITVKKHNQEDVQYTDSSTNGKYCRNCKKFDPPVGCYGVNGQINRNGWCNKYEQVVGIGLPIASNLTTNLPQTGVKKYD